MQPTFFDDFDTLDLIGASPRYLTRWHYTPAGDASCSLPGNGEVEQYVNVDGPLAKTVTPWVVKDSVLSLICAKQADGSYTSGMLNTFGTFAQKYGYFAIRCRLTKAPGSWPAFWLLPADGSWPPEIDVFESLGMDPKNLYCTVHSNATGGHTSTGLAVPESGLADDFHTYAVDWTPSTVTWYLDGAQVFQAPTPADCHQPMYLVIDQALGGWGGPPLDTALPSTFDIDWIKVWAEKPAGGAVHRIDTPWGGQVIRDFLPGDSISLGFSADRLDISYDGADTVVSAWVAGQWKWACTVLGVRLAGLC